jgi:hypothetical protein
LTRLYSLEDALIMTKDYFELSSPKIWCFSGYITLSALENQEIREAFLAPLPLPYMPYQNATQKGRVVYHISIFQGT